MKKLALGIAAFFIAAFLWSMTSFAGTKTFSWDLPTQWENGDPLDPLTDIEKVSIYCNGSLTSETTGPVTTLEIELPSGVYDCYSTAWATNGQESAPSNSVNFIILRIPRSPTNFNHS